MATIVEPAVIEITSAQAAALQRWLGNVDAGYSARVWTDEDGALFALGADVGVLAVARDGGVPDHLSLPAAIAGARSEEEG